MRRVATVADSDRGLDTRLRQGREAYSDILTEMGDLGVGDLWVAAAKEVL